MAFTKLLSTDVEEETAQANIRASFKMVDTTMTSNPTDAFNPEQHITYKPPAKIYSMHDIKLQDSPISSFAVSEPFQLFTPEAVRRMRAEIFKPEVTKNFQYSSNLAQCQLRGYAAK